jgi:hypothetical protein
MRTLTWDLLRALVLPLLALVLVGCAGTGTRISRGPDGLLTWTSDTAECQAAISGPPIGTLQGAANDVERVWVVAPDGRRLSLVWPGGFTVRFEPDAVLYGPTGVAVARTGDPIDINRAAPEQGATPDDPMPVVWVNHVCYASAAP